MPHNQQTRPCRGCGAEVFFARSASTGRPMCMNADPVKGTFVVDKGVALYIDVYTSHHATCPKAADFRKDRGPASQHGAPHAD